VVALSRLRGGQWKLSHSKCNETVTMVSRAISGVVVSGIAAPTKGKMGMGGSGAGRPKGLRKLSNPAFSA